MKKIIFLFFISFSIYSAENLNYLFINSSPIRAKVIIDGRETQLMTPCVIKEKDIEKHSIVLRKATFRDYHISLEEIKTGKIDVVLVPATFEIFFPQRSAYKIGNTQVRGPVYIANLKEGTYTFDLVENRLNFRKTTALTPVEASLGTAFGLSLTAMITTIALNSYFNEQKYIHQYTDQDEYYHYTKASQGMSSAQFAMVGVTSALGLALSSVIIVDVITRYRQKKQKMEILNRIPTTQDETFYNTALQFLSTGDIERSSQILRSILSLYPDSDILPMVYYQLGQNYFIVEDYENALKYWEIFIRDFPLSDYYDYVIKNLADIYYSDGDFETARNMLNRVLFTQDMLNRESIYSLRANLDFELYKKTRDDIYYSLCEIEYQQLIEDFPQSERLDIYYLMLINLYNLSGDVDKINELKAKVESLTHLDDSMRKLILSYF
ncbi:MAG: tetratricopeptide repeat protein [Spirochaetes bacterium]|nr:tetratricopeptide repeat protein [Spirochaetota bacterium]